jgi:signal transduction histidine kinase
MPNQNPALSRIEAMLRQPAMRIWLPAALIIIALFIALGPPAHMDTALIPTALLALLLFLGHRLAIELEDGSALTPAPALLIAGLTLVSWPLLLAAALLGTLATLVFRPRSLARTLAESGSRCLVAGLITPVYLATLPPGGLPDSTPAGLLGLLLIGALAYTVELLTSADSDTPTPLPARLRARFTALRWYVLAMVPLGGLLGALWPINLWLFVLGLAPLAVAQYLFGSAIALRRTSADLARIARQHEALAARTERLQALATTMIGTLDVQAMLEILCRRLAALLDAPAGWVVLLDESAHPQLMAHHNLPADGQLSIPDPQGYLALLERGKVMLVTDERGQALMPTNSDRPPQWLAVLCIPLLGEGDGTGTTAPLLGAICLAFEQLRGLDAGEQRVLSSFAHQAAVSIENARLFDALGRKQAELIQSSKLAAVGTFAAGIAHEFNNLLGSMLGNAELGQRMRDLDEKDHALTVVIQACRRGRSITRGLLTFARRQEHHRAMANVIDAIDETLTLVEIELQKSHIQLVRAIEPVPSTVCDLGQLAQVVLNLITNARDAMLPAGGTLTIGLRERRNLIEISVGDTGMGIPAEIRDKIFEPFITTKGTLDGSQTPGTGLGLSVSYGIVQEHGGTIEVDSTPGRGTTMTVRLPVVSAEAFERELVVGA